MKDSVKKINFRMMLPVRHHKFFTLFPKLVLIDTPGLSSSYNKARLSYYLEMNKCYPFIVVPAFKACGLSNEVLNAINLCKLNSDNYSLLITRIEEAVCTKCEDKCC